MQINKKNKRGQTHLHQGCGGQGAIDMTLVVVVMCVILFAVLKMFVWFNQSLVERQEAFGGGQSYSPPPVHLIRGEGQ